MHLTDIDGSIAIFWGLKDVNAQSTQSGHFRIMVQVQNTGNLDEHGSLHVAIDGSRNPQTMSGLSFQGYKRAHTLLNSVLLKCQ